MRFDTLKQSNKSCANSHCKIIVSLEWYNSFNFKEFDKEFMKNFFFDDCEDV